MKKAHIFSVLLAIFLIPLLPTYSVKVLIIALILSIFLRFTRANITNALNQSWDILLYIIVVTVGILYSENWRNGLAVLETNFSMIAMPVILLPIYDDPKGLGGKIFRSFEFGLVCAGVVCLVHSSLQFLQTSDAKAFFYYELTEIIDSHPTYLAYYLIFGVTYRIYLMYYSTDKPTIFQVSILFFLFGLLMLTGGRTAYVSLLFVFAFFILRFVTDEIRTQKRGTFVIVVCLSVGLLGMNYLSYFRNGLTKSNDNWERTQLWYSAVKANPNPLIGVGTGDYKAVLNNYYMSHNLEEFARENYNSHNQFIQFYFSNGIIGLIILIILIGRPLYLSVKDQNALGILLIFPFVIYGVTEVFLGRYQGVVFFTFLHQLVIHQHYSRRFPSFLTKIDS